LLVKLTLKGITFRS